MNYKLRFNMGKRREPSLGDQAKSISLPWLFRQIMSGLCSLCLLLNSSALCRPGSLGVKQCEIARFFALNALALKPFADSRNFLPSSVIRCFGRLGFYGYPVNFTGGWGMGGSEIKNLELRMKNLNRNACHQPP